MVFDRYPKRGDVLAEASRSLEHAGIFGAKIEAVSTSRSRDLLSSLRMPVFDASFELPYALRGPVLAGRLRHRGLGIFMPA
jgi:FAD synthase